MELKLLSIAAVVIASCIVMIVHEIPKTIVFFCLEKRKNLIKQLLKSYQHIDPIGLIFSIAGYSGFSKAYMLRAKRDKDNILLGVAGYITLFVLFLIGILVCKFGFGAIDTLTNPQLLLFLTFQYISIMSFGMFVVNLFPIMSLDMGLIIAGISRDKYFSIIRNDYFLKMILVLSVLLGIIRSMGVGAFLFLYQI